MHKALVRIGSLSLIVAALHALASCGTGVGMNASTCRTDEEIDRSLRDGASKTALEFVGKLLEPDTILAYKYLAPALKSIHSPEVFEAQVKAIQSSGPYSDVKIAHLYEPSLTGSGSQPVICGQLSDAEHWVSVPAKPGITQIHAVVAAQTKNNDWAATIWLAKDGDAWHVLSYYVSMASMAGHYPAELLADARDQEAKGHALNAHMLYFAAASLVDRGPSFQLGLKQDVESGLANHKPPPELAGKAPFLMRLAGQEYSVEGASILGIDKKLFLILLYRDKEWSGTDNADAECRNRKFLDAFVKAHPEYSESFGGLVARILPVGSEHGWGTVFDTLGGYK